MFFGNETKRNYHVSYELEFEIVPFLPSFSNNKQHERANLRNSCSQISPILSFLPTNVDSIDILHLSVRWKTIIYRGKEEALSRLA